MGCFLALLALISPRLVLFFLWIFSDVLSRAFDSWIVPLLGFFLLPWTTLTYAAFWHWGSGRHVTGFEWFFVILAFLIDLGSYGGGGRARAPPARPPPPAPPRAGLTPPAVAPTAAAGRPFDEAVVARGVATTRVPRRGENVTLRRAT